jgi:hypothetical protein
VAYAVPSSFPYSWLSNGDRLNYGQWKRGATWAIADYYSSADADAPGADFHSKHPERPAAAPSRAVEERPHEKV